MCSVLSASHMRCGLNVKCPPQVCVFKYLVPSIGDHVLFGKVMEPLREGIYLEEVDLSGGH